MKSFQPMPKKRLTGSSADPMEEITLSLMLPVAEYENAQNTAATTKMVSLF